MQLVFFSDLDGTLLDHETYDFTPALPALKALRQNHIPVILASSKTGAELLELRINLDLEEWPVIIENGAGIVPSGEDVPLDHSVYHQLRRELNQIPESLRMLFHGFGDMHVSEIAQITGLKLDSARLAQQRAYTEPGVFNGTSGQQAEFISEVNRLGIRATDGGRFLTLSYGRTKADAMHKIVAQFNASKSVALGDAPNDREMLLAASQAVIVRNDISPKVVDIPGAIYTTLSGPAGWNEAVLSLLESGITEEN